jgi:D-alanyl-D-alanine carboxypeptidase/D-alanyl-D-alanine-endopeptidase (penicillin-binding protein 4)
MIGRRRLLAGLLGAAATPLWAEDPGVAPQVSLRPEPRPDRRTGADGAAEAQVRAAKLGGEVAFAVAALGSEGLLGERYADVEMPPASVAKSITTLYSLEKLGPDHRFQTRVMRAGSVRDGVLDGDLLLVGGGDPNLDTDTLGDLVAALAATGLTRITGRFVVVDGALPFRERLVDDQPDQVGYNPTLSGLILNYNRVHFEWTKVGKGWTTTVDARGERFRPAVDVAQVAIEARDLPIFTYARKKGLDAWTVADTALNEAGSRWLPVRDPAAYVAAAFATLAAAQGLKLPAAEYRRDVTEGAQLIVAHQGDALRKVLADMLKFSTNLTAEVVGMTASGAGSLEGSGAAMTVWAQRELGVGMRLHDHSGLQSSNRVTARDMVLALQRAKGQRHGALLESLMREMGLPEAEGAEIKGSATRIHAKSGTMNFVSGLAGYVRGPGDAALVFAIFSGDVARRQAVPIAARESPEGGAAWVKRARRMQGQLIATWAKAYL